MTLQEKIIELLPKEKACLFPCIECDNYNKALQDVKEKLPEILKLIREEVGKLQKFTGGSSVEQKDIRVKLQEVLELLK